MPINEFGPDGTQAPPPPRLYPDPLAGLVTADSFVAPQWTSFSSRVVVPTPPEPTEEARQAVWSQMQQEQRRPRGRAQRAPVQHQAHQYAVQQFAPTYQMSAPQQQQQQQQPAKQTSGVAAFIGCLVVIGFFVLVLVSILGAIFS
ncbi:hypothetical protein SAMN04488564_104195 [Lentzea waywayandensis]|uniref:Uncharacterized protein n=1 Tax=Lentzea waywayandensis TaxID=84724 RepID=A0A1I6ECY2_9PSEU|nr:hypothetical protein [Lentzea waywayandensis]SFR15610.1 hypothetical protein SAMN04488564_104195 [Lentzea waywayandensis]